MVDFEIRNQQHAQRSGRHGMVDVALYACSGRRSQAIRPAGADR